MIAKPPGLSLFYKQVESNLETMGQNILKLVRHPDTTPEQLEVARNAYAEAYSKWSEVHFRLQQKRPGPGFPWSLK